MNTQTGATLATVFKLSDINNLKLSTGVYILKNIFTDGSVSTKKIIK